MSSVALEHPRKKDKETWAASGYQDLAERNPLRYRAYYHDAATGLYYLPARYYDPETMRFLSPDSAAPSAGEPLSLNRYAYCVGDPVNRTDPSGARHEAGGGSSRVAEEAIDLAREGRLEEAKEVQAAYRRAVSSAYAGGATYDTAHAAARTAALTQRQKLGDGTPFGAANDILMPSAPSQASWGLAIAGSTLEFGGAAITGVSVGSLIVVGVATNAASIAIDASYISQVAYPGWQEGTMTKGDFFWSIWSAVPLVGSPSTLGVLIGDWACREVFDSGIDWARPVP